MLKCFYCKWRRMDNMNFNEYNNHTQESLIQRSFIVKNENELKLFEIRKIFKADFHYK